MNITIEDLENRKKTLQEELDGLLSKANAISGAIQDCDYWLEQIKLEKEDPNLSEG
ncbi:MAG: hypothetical protein WA061_02275 [Microgenomates group bacterium]